MFDEQPKNPLHGITLKFLRKTAWARTKVERLYPADRRRAERRRPG